MKFDWKSYFEPTPKLALKAGAAFKGMSGASIPMILLGSKTVGLAMLFSGMFGDFLTNFFREDKDSDVKKQ